MTTSSQYVWQGQWLAADVFNETFPSISSSLQDGLALKHDCHLVIDGCAALGKKLAGEENRALEKDLLAVGVSESMAKLAIEDVRAVLTREYIERKFLHELSTMRAFRLRRINYRSDVFEGWMPLGTILHITPGNSPSAGFLSVVESLLTGNVSILKDTPRNGFFSIRLMAMLGEVCPELQPLLYGFSIPSTNTSAMNLLYASVDGVAAWGGDSTMQAVRAAVAPGVKLIEWGHHISFAYFSEEKAKDEDLLERLAHDVCQMEQQACSSPQVLYIDTDDFEVVKKSAEFLAQQVNKVSPGYPSQEISIHEQAEITATSQMVKLQQPYDDAYLIEDTGGSWRLYVENHPELKASPLYRSLWVKPLPKNKIISVLKPYRRLLQTVILGVKKESIAEFSQLLLQGGSTRIVSPGNVFSAYPGEPHDGVVALTQYCKKVAVQNFGESLDGIVELDELLPQRQKTIAQDTPLTDKSYFTDGKPPVNSQIFVKSGGSSNMPKLCGYTVGDYNSQMEVGADSLFAAGFDVHTDRCINLFYAGHLYGGFLSIFTVLEKLSAVQFPMTAIPELDQVADIIVANNINTLCAMPTYVLRLFKEHGEQLKEYGGVKKVFYGGEMFLPKQAAYLQEEFGVEIIRSLSYGSNDIGPMAFACSHCTGTTHHLSTDAQILEIFKLYNDEPVDKGETGRLLFTPKLREGQQITRYEIGDLGRWVEGICPCGRTSPRFELMGRYGDIFKSATHFLNYRIFTKILEEVLGYSGRVQLVLSFENNMDVITVRLDPADSLSKAQVKQAIIENYAEVYDAVVAENGLKLKIEFVTGDAFIRTTTSDKLISVIDERL